MAAAVVPLVLSNLLFQFRKIHVGEMRMKNGWSTLYMEENDTKIIN